MKDLVVAVDPGREKCGVAVVGRQAGVIHKEIVPTTELTSAVKHLTVLHNTYHIVLGDRTGSKQAQKTLQAASSAEHPLHIHRVDEHRSTDEARQRYWLDHPPKGWRALLPVTMQTPPVPVDDYVAVILAERFLSNQ